MSQFLSGIGTTLVGIMGITYMDDNVKRKQSPMLLGTFFDATVACRVECGEYVRQPAQV